MFTALLAQADAGEELNWVVSVDSTIVRATSTRLEQAVRITVEARDPRLAERTAYQLAMLTSGSGPTEPEPTSDGTYSVWIYARPEAGTETAAIP